MNRSQPEEEPQEQDPAVAGSDEAQDDGFRASATDDDTWNGAQVRFESDAEIEAHHAAQDAELSAESTATEAAPPEAEAALQPEAPDTSQLPASPPPDVDGPASVAVDEAESAAPERATRPGCLIHFVLLTAATALSIQDSVHLPDNQAFFLAFTALTAYLYPMLWRWMNPKSGYALGLVQWLMLLGVAECVGLLAWELRTSALSQAGPGALLLAGLPVLAMTMTALVGYTLGWCFLVLWHKLFLWSTRPDTPLACEDKDQD